MSDDNQTIINPADFGFDPSYGYSMEQLLAVPAPRAPKDFDVFWQNRYQHALTIATYPQISITEQIHPQWQVLMVSFNSTENCVLHGWLLLPKEGTIKRGMIVGHGYGGRNQPDFYFPFTETALFFPCFRGLGISTQPGISSNPYWHVRHDLDKLNEYILGGCVEDLWLATSALLSLYPHLAGHLGYLGFSFSGGIGALALAWETRIARAHLSVPTFGNHPLRLRLPSQGSALSLQHYYVHHKKSTLKVLSYYDAAIAAQRITIPVHCACALFDPCVAPPGQFAIYNALAGEKQLYVLTAGHYQYAAHDVQQQEILNELVNFFAPLESITA